MKTTTATAPAIQATTPDPTKLCKITNSSGVDIQVALPVSTAESLNPDSIVSFNKDLEILQVQKGGTVIKNGDTDSVLLDRTHKDSKTGKPVYSLGYDLLVSSNNWLLPIANIGVIQDFDDDHNDFFDPVIVTATAKTAMQQTVDFYQIIAAYPDSKLAKDYIGAMNNVAKDAGSKANGGNGSAENVNNAITGGVANFFKNTKSYQQVTLANIVALESYYNKFPYAWAQYSDTVSYFLYSSDGRKTSFVGKLTLTKTALDITKANGGYTAKFAPAVTPTDTSKTDVDATKAKGLTYSGGIFVDDAGADEPEIAMKGTFQLKRTFTKDPADTKIMVVMSGTVYGQVCIGFDADQATKADDTTQDWLNKLFHPKTAEEIFNSVMQILGALMMLDFVGTALYNAGKTVVEAVRNKLTVSEDELEGEISKAESEYKATQESAYKKVARDKAKLPENADDALSQAANEKGSISDQVSAAKAKDSINQMKDNLKEIEQFAAEDAELQSRLEDSARDVRSAFEKLSGEVADLKAALAELRPELKTLSENVSKLNTDVAEAASADQKAQMDENVKEMNQIQDDVEKENKTAEDEANDGTDTDPDSEPIEFPEF